MMRGAKEEQMDTTTTMAISKAVKEKDAKAARKALAPGEYPVHAVVEIEGTLIVAPDTEATPTSSLLSEDFMVMVLKMAGCTRERAAHLIRDVAQAYLAGWTGSETDKAAADAARKAMVAEYDPNGEIGEIFDEVKRSLPKVPRAGSVSFKGQVAEVEVAASNVA